MAPPQGYAPVATTEYEPDSKPAVPQVPVAPAQAQGIPPEQPQVLLGHPVLLPPRHRRAHFSHRAQALMPNIKSL